MIKFTTAASAAALLAIAGMSPALAQSSASGTSSGKQGLGGMSITCRDLASLDQDQARGVIYWLNGYAAAGSSTMANQQASGSAATGTGAAGSSASSSASGSTASTSDSSGTGATGSGSTTTDATGSTGSADATAGASGTSGASGSTGQSTADSSGSATSGAAGGSTGQTTANNTGSASNSGMNTVTAQLPGYSNIDIAGIMSQCASNPEMRLSDMISSNAGTGTAQ